MKHAGPRHVGREFALRILFAFNLEQEERPMYQTPGWWQPDDSLSVNKEADRFARHMIKGIAKQREEINDLIRHHAKNWRLERMPIVDRDILRLSIWQLLNDSETPVNVILDEALEMAKCYGEENSPRFINGILDRIAHALNKNHTPSQSSE